jgi:galactitol-specific phosphotransferase system IIB component
VLMDVFLGDWELNRADLFCSSKHLRCQLQTPQLAPIFVIGVGLQPTPITELICAIFIVVV